MGDIINIYSDIPVNWSVSKLKYFSSIYTGNSLNDAEKNKFSNDEDGLEGRIYISSKDINVHNNSCNYDTDIIIPYNETKYKLAPLGSSLLCIEGGSAGKKLTFTKQEVCFVNKLACFTGEDSESSKFIYYYLQSDGFKVQFNSSLSGLIGGVSLTNLNDFQVPIPQKQTQIHIAKFLDKKTAEIDAIIEKKENLLLLLEEKKKAIINEAVTKGINPNAPMKDSGIEWIGEIPEHWEVSKLKYFVSIKGRLGWKGLKADEYVESGYGFLSTPDIKNDEIDFSRVNYITEERYLESPEIMLEKGDVLLVKDGSTLGIINRVKELPIPSTVNSSIAVLRIEDSSIISEFLFYLLKSNWIQKTIEFLKQGQGVPHLFQKDIKEFDLIIPPIAEQETLINEIYSRCKIVDDLNVKIQSQIDKLKEYRQSLISEAVTGKIDI
ncbi:MAG: restriction endonuclease subunit S [Sphingobacterium mizutaii]|nr:restriction endonuclease subunit S [Sphingobacterium mizutaii]